MAKSHMMVAVAIPATLLLVANTVQGTAQSCDAIGIAGAEAESRIRTMALLTGGVVVVAAATSRDPATIVAAAVTAALTVYLFDRVTLTGKGLPWISTQ